MRKRWFGMAGAACVMTLLASTAFAGRAVKLRADLTQDCFNCRTDLTPDGTGDYSLLVDFGPYDPGNGVKSEILNNNSVYTLDTMDTLVNGVVGPGTRFVRMHFYTGADPIVYPNNVLPGCWDGPDQNQAVNWSVFAYNSQSFLKMQTGVAYPGWARMDFNVRNGVCDRQIYRYYLRWYSATIVRTDANTWVVTSGDGSNTNWGEANLRGQGGRKKETIDYGDWRMPFRLVLSQQ